MLVQAWTIVTMEDEVGVREIWRLKDLKRDFFRRRQAQTPSSFSRRLHRLRRTQEPLLELPCGRRRDEKIDNASA